MTKGKPQTTKNNTAQENLTERLERKETVRGTALTIAGGFLWGIAGVFGKYTFEYKGVTATWIVNVRLIIAGIILLTRAYMVQKDGIFRIWKNKRHVLRMLVYGVIGIAGCQMTYYLAVEDSNAGIATVLQYTAPVMIMVLLALKNWKLPGKNEILALILMIGTSVFMPAAATYTICDGFHNAIKIPMWVSALIIALILAVVVIGGVKRISAIASMIVPFMVTVYLIAAVVIIVMNITAVPALIKTVVTAAFAKNAVFGGTIGVIIQQGVKRGTFSSASGMGEASPTAAAAETSHPVKQGMANAAGVWLDTVIVCTASGLMILLTDCFNTAGGYVGSGSTELPALAAAGTNGVIFVQLACKTVMGKIAPTFIAIMLALFSFTCLISYYYEAETAAMYLFQGESKAKVRKVVTWIMRIAMPVLIFIWGNLESDIAWNLSDLALGSCTWVNMLIVLLLSPKVIALYKDYEEQMKAKKDPYYNPDKISWSGVDKEMWKDINKKYIENDK